MLQYFLQAVLNVYCYENFSNTNKLGGEIQCLRTVYVHTLFDLVNFVLRIFMELVYPKVL